MLERILVPLDGSLRSELILGQLGRLLHGKDVQVLLLRVLPPDVQPKGSPLSGFLKEERGAAEKYIDDLVERVRQGGARAKGYVIGGEVAPVILKVAETEKSTLIAMTTHGRSGLSRWIMGSVAEKVVRGSSVPVLVVRSFIPGSGGAVRQATAEELSIGKILIPTDGSPYAAAAVTPALELARVFGSEAVVVHAEYPFVLPGPEMGALPTSAPTPALRDPVTKPAAEALAAAGIRVTRVTEIGDPAGVILDQCQAGHADLIVMATHGRSGVGRWILGSVAERVLHHAHVPLLLVRAPGKGKQRKSVAAVKRRKGVRT
jgi:nucleotide-binding universal stress UspA family protein